MVPFRVANKDRFPTCKDGQVKEVVLYANLTGLRRFHRYVANLTGFTVLQWIYHMWNGGHGLDSFGSE
jgi:hypothetical protein